MGPELVTAAPHRWAEEAGLRVLAEGGTAIEAAVAMAAALAVVYPHMTGLGGDGFWLIAEPGRPPRALRSCGPAAAAADLPWYAARGHTALPTRGPHAALTVAGAVSGWNLALELSATWSPPLPRSRLLEDARRYALQGLSVSRSQADLTRAKAAELLGLPGFQATFAPRGLPAAGDVLTLPALAQVFDRLSADGFDALYRGDLARDLAADLQDLGSPLTLADLQAYRAAWVEPLALEVSVGTLWNLPPPTQGVSSLAILGLFDRVAPPQGEGFDHVHRLVEATKQAFTWRNAHVGDPATMAAQAGDLLSGGHLDRLAADLPLQTATPWPQPAAAGDTVWFGAIDGAGRAVSVIQSLYWEFGAGIVLPRTGLTWQNRGSSFSWNRGPNQLGPGKLPFHTLNPALARLRARGGFPERTVAYGTMGGEGQPQTQAAVLTRHAWYGASLAEAVAAPRWLLGRTWGEDSFSLRLEDRWDPSVVSALKAAGHAVETVAAWDDRMGHAGAVAVDATGRTEATHDPRADGGGLGFDPASPEDVWSWRLEGFLAALARHGAEADGGVTRRLYDQAWVSARSWLEEQFRAGGLSPRSDRVGNLYGRLEGTEGGPVILAGSHFDTVRHGGWYDGAYGVAAATLAVAALRERWGPPRRTVEVVAFAEEEGSRFPLAYWGSGHLTGLWPEGHGDTLRDSDGVTLSEAMRQAGFGRADQADPRRTDLAAYLEVHIEQGIVLERSGERVGVVEAIVGQRRWLVRVTGEANHAGTTPMGLRRDALAGAAAMMGGLEALARDRGDPLVATVGFVSAEPNTPNVIPGTVSFSVDARHTDGRSLETFVTAAQDLMTRVAAERGLGLAFEPRLRVEPVAMDAGLRDSLQRACRARGLSQRALPSGAGHDAQVLAAQVPSALLFVPSRRGVSHSPQELSTHQALADGLAVLTDVLYDLAWKGTPR